MSWFRGEVTVSLFGRYMSNSYVMDVRRFWGESVCWWILKGLDFWGVCLGWGEGWMNCAQTRRCRLVLWCNLSYEVTLFPSHSLYLRLRLCSFPLSVSATFNLSVIDVGGALLSRAVEAVETVQQHSFTRGYLWYLKKVLMVRILGTLRPEESFHGWGMGANVMA
jgi:hypothetical protein